MVNIIFLSRLYVCIYVYDQIVIRMLFTGSLSLFIFRVFTCTILIMHTQQNPVSMFVFLNGCNSRNPWVQSASHLSNRSVLVMAPMLQTKFQLSPTLERVNICKPIARHFRACLLGILFCSLLSSCGYNAKYSQAL